MAVRPHLFVGFLLWLWFLSPFIRRIADYQSGWRPASLIIATPLLVTALCALTVVRHARRLPRSALFPSTIAIAACSMAFAIGVALNGMRAAAYGFGTWVCPIFFGIYLHVHWRRFQYFRRALESACTWGLLAIGLYGVWQYVDPPAWDRFWMVNSGMGSIGKPAPFRVRVFSTLNSPGALATAMVAGLLVVIVSRHRLRWAAGVAGTLALMLSAVRSAWLVGGVALAVLLRRLPGRQRLHILLAFVTMAALAQGALTSGSMQDVVRSRAGTLTNLSEDVSYQARLHFAIRATAAVMSDPLGSGLGATGAASRLASTGLSLSAFDNGVLDIFYSLGWIGGLLFLCAVAWTADRSRRAARARRDGFSAAASALVVALIVLLGAANSLTGIGGVLFWGFAGLLQGGAQHLREEAGPASAAAAS